MSRLYSHPREYRKKFLANYLCIGFVPGGMLFTLHLAPKNVGPSLQGTQILVLCSTVFLRVPLKPLCYSVWPDFESAILGIINTNSRVNNLTTSELVTCPPFLNIFGAIQVDKLLILGWTSY